MDPIFFQMLDVIAKSTNQIILKEYQTVFDNRENEKHQHIKAYLESNYRNCENINFQ